MSRSLSAGGAVSCGSGKLDAIDENRRESTAAPPSVVPDDPPNLGGEEECQSPTFQSPARNITLISFLKPAKETGDFHNFGGSTQARSHVIHHEDSKNRRRVSRMDWILVHE